MAANSPEEICYLFKRFMSEGDIDSLLTLYEPKTVFQDESGELRIGLRELRQVLKPFALAKATFDFTLQQIIEADDIALMHTKWTVSSPKARTLYAIEVARRQGDGTWRWLIGDPYTLSKQVVRDSVRAA